MSWRLKTSSSSLAFFERPVDFIVNVGRHCHAIVKSFGFLTERRSRIRLFVRGEIERVGDAQERAQFAHHVLIAGRQLAEAEMFWTRVRFAVIARDIGDEIEIEFVKRVHTGALDQDSRNAYDAWRRAMKSPISCSMRRGIEHAGIFFRQSCASYAVDKKD